MIALDGAGSGIDEGWCVVVVFAGVLPFWFVHPRCRVGVYEGHDAVVEPGECGIGMVLPSLEFGSGVGLDIVSVAVCVEVVVDGLYSARLFWVFPLSVVFHDVVPYRGSVWPVDVLP